MKGKTAISIFLINLLILNCFSQTRPVDERLREMVMKYSQAEVIIPNPGKEALSDLTRHVSITSVKDKKVLLKISPLDIDWFIGQVFDYTVNERKGDAGIISARSMAEAMEWESYPTYTQYDSIMRFFATAHTSLCSLDTIGTSIRGKLVLALRISDNSAEDGPEPAVFYTSTMHGDETGGFIMMLRLADYLLNNYYTDPDVRDLVDNLEIWINPLANPDGTYNNGNEIDSPVRFNANNYDLNRNFPDPTGPFTVRQKETLDMMSFLSAHRFVLSANFHSGEEVINYPWDRWRREHADVEWFKTICRQYADTAHLYAPAGYMTYLNNGITNGYAWYPVNGSRQDYVTWDLHGREITVELDEDYITPVQALDSLWEFNRRSFLGYLRNARYGIYGFVTDSETGLPVPAKIFTEGHDMNNSEIYADTINGRYLRMIEPGVWDITFSADGYKTTTVTGITSETRIGTELNVEMEKISNPADTINREMPILYPNPAGTYIRAILPEDILGIVNVKVFSQNGIEILEDNQMVLYGNPYELNLSELAPGVYFAIFTSQSNGKSCTGRFVVAGGL
jgi:hypothetical protein